MIDALSDFLISHGYTNVYIDNLPDEAAATEAIGIFCWDNPVAEINDGSGTFYVQLQVRRSTSAEAHKVCNDLFKLLDSGLNEQLLQLNDDHWCIARPRRGAVIIDRTSNTTTYYCEIALWGEI